MQDELGSHDMKISMNKTEVTNRKKMNVKGKHRSSKYITRDNWSKENIKRSRAQAKKVWISNDY